MGVLKLAYGIEYSRQFYWNILSKVFSLSTVLDFGHYLCSSDSVCCRSCVALLLFIFCNKSKPSALSLSLFKQLTGYLDVSQFLYFPPHHPLFSTVMYLDVNPMVSFLMLPRVLLSPCSLSLKHKLSWCIHGIYGVSCHMFTPFW